ncbi:sugar kinase [Aquibaculum arenosum]|uniref:Sugar kinase n=1 Tax=Aquibaculum arenosum TaxID=3032591 RepID=A0ABT5YPC6_9PROT|nr:sugar kinase [Fodinicurvata sp. CAU 1616]MDF2096734.1 sugar kinase [Fodinicurvata sp. CAU 1616]
MEPFDIVGLGEPMVEFSQVPGSAERRNYLQGFGGDTSNAVITAARQSARCGFVTALGHDPFGDALEELWTEEGVDCSGVVRFAQAPTGIYFITHGPDGHAFTYCRAGSAASRLGPEDLPLPVLRNSGFLHVSGISQAISDRACDGVFRAIDEVRAAGGRISYDTNLRRQLWPLPRARAVIHEAIRGVDVALPGLDDALALTGLSDPEAIVDFYLGLDCRLVALKLGAKGVLLATGERRALVPGFPVEAVDASGAGDCFDGAFLAELTRGTDPFDAARYANAAAALSTTGYGAVAPIPRRAEVEAFLAQRSEA